MRTILSHELPEHVRGMLAQRLVAELGSEYADWTVESQERDLANTRGLPLTICALNDNGVVMGSASLLPTDEVSGLDDVTPWLGDLLVLEEFRGRGIGRTLVQAIQRAARDRAFHTLHLVTSSTRDWYVSLGWEEVGPADVHGHCMTHMRITL